MCVLHFDRTKAVRGGSERCSARAALLKYTSRQDEGVRKRGPQHSQTMDAYEKLEKIGEGVSGEGGREALAAVVSCFS